MSKISSVGKLTKKKNDQSDKGKHPKHFEFSSTFVSGNTSIKVSKNISTLFSGNIFIFDFVRVAKNKKQSMILKMDIFKVLLTKKFSTKVLINKVTRNHLIIDY